jgi:hypothetical protein
MAMLLIRAPARRTTDDDPILCRTDVCRANSPHSCGGPNAADA